MGLKMVMPLNAFGFLLEIKLFIKFIIIINVKPFQELALFLLLFFAFYLMS